MNGLDGVKKVVVIGLGMTGLSVVNHLLRQPDEFEIKVIDTRPTPPGRDELPSNVALTSKDAATVDVVTLPGRVSVRTTLDPSGPDVARW